MSGFIKDENSLANGIPNRNIGPETGSFGNATMTNKGDTAEGTNQDHEGRPAPAAGLEGAELTTDLGEPRSFASGPIGSAAADLPEGAVEPVYQQIADGGDRFDHDKLVGEDDDERKDRLAQERRMERREEQGHEGMSDDKLGRPLSDDRMG